jgi:hypothetical protein
MWQANEAAYRAHIEKKNPTKKVAKKPSQEKTTRKKVIYFKGSNGLMWQEVEIESGSRMMEATFLLHAPPKARSYKRPFKDKTILRKKAA